MISVLSRPIIHLGNVFGIDQSISRKISFGYVLALGTAVIGISGGLLGSHYYAKPMQMKAQHMRQKKQLLSDFNAQLLGIQTHPLRLLAIAGESSIWVQYEHNQFNTNLRQLNHVLDELEQLVTSSTQPDIELTALINEYRLTLLAYDEFIHRLQNRLSGINDKQTATETLAAALSTASVSELSTIFERLSEDLTRFQQAADRNYDEATMQLQKVERLRLIIILGSMTISIGLAIVFATITSRTIARPIEHLTQIAHKVTQEKNFQLQVSIRTDDEVSLLAQALNKLMDWVGQYTTDLEEARQTLENRVEERTRALQQSEESLRQKANDLQRTLNELQQTQAQLIQSEKMSSLGQMVAGVAHEINNPINFIHGNLAPAIQYVDDVMGLLDLYQNSYPAPNAKIQATIDEIDLPFLREDFPSLIQSMEEGTTRIRDIVTSLRSFSRLDQAAVKEVELHDGIDSTLTILQNRLKATPDVPEIQIVRNYEHLPPVECFAGQLNQVFMNILSNSIDALRATPNISKPAITIATQTIDSDWIVVHISDNGPGIPEAILTRLFDPFFTTKPVGEGTGLGLSISYQIIAEKHRGYLGCESPPGQGARFTIKLPIRLSTHLN